MTAERPSRRRLRVAFVDQVGETAGGAERSLALLLEHLPSDVEPEVILYSDGSFAGDLRERGFPVTIISLPKSLLKAKRERFSPGEVAHIVTAIAQTRAVLARLQPDVVYTNTMKAHLLGAIAARSLGIPAIAHVRDIVSGGARNLLRTVLQTSTKRRVAISRAVNRSIGLDRTTVVTNPLDLAQYAQPPSREAARSHLNLPPDVPIVGTVGRINRWKGQDDFLRVAKVVADASVAHFAIVGSAVFRDEDFVDELHRFAGDLGIANRVHFVPWLANPIDAFAALDVHCNTSRQEPFGRTTIEAAALGKPTISFDDGGAEDAVASDLSRDIVAAGDIPAFAAATLAYVNDPDRLARAAPIAIEHSKTFDATLHGNRIGALIRSEARS